MTSITTVARFQYARSNLTTLTLVDKEASPMLEEFGKEMKRWVSASPKYETRHS